MANALNTILVGPGQTLLQNVVYALPARNVHLFSDTALQASNDVAFGASLAILANTAVQVSAAYVRCTTGNAIIHCAAD